MLKRASLFISLLFVTAVFLTACGSQTETPPAVEPLFDMAANTNTIPVDGGGTYTDITADGLAVILENEDIPLINVHIPYAGELPGTDEFIPFNEMALNVDKLPADKDAQFAIYCRSGSMSAESARDLVEMGYSNVLNLDGGMNGWVASGRELIQK